MLDASTIRAYPRQRFDFTIERRRVARIRMIKPEFFDDPDIGDLTFPARLFFIGLWTQADRAGRLREDFRRLKARLFPFDPAVKIEELLEELTTKDMVRRYQDRAGTNLIWVRNFAKHQRPHLKEQESVIDACPETTTKVVVSPNQAMACPPDSGVLSLDSGVLSLENGGSTPPPAVISSMEAWMKDPAPLPLTQTQKDMATRKAMAAAMRRPHDVHRKRQRR